MTGQLYIVSAPSGAGKSSLLGLMSLSLRATEGEVVVLDTRISRLKRRAFPAAGDCGTCRSR